MTTTLTPLADRVLVKPQPADTVSAGGVHLPDAAQERPQSGTVVAVGPGQHKHGPPDLTPGDQVLYSKYGGTEIEHDGQELLVLKETDIIARLARPTTNPS